MTVQVKDGLQLKQEGSDKKHKNWRGLELWNDQNVQISCHEPRYDLVLIQAMQTNCNKQQVTAQAPSQAITSGVDLDLHRRPGLLLEKPSAICPLPRAKHTAAPCIR